MFAIFEVNGMPEVFVVESYNETSMGWCSAKLRSSFVNEGVAIHAAIKIEDIQ